MFAPFGVFLATALLLYLTGKAQWNNGENLELSASLVDLGAVLYAMVAVLVERGVRMWFWALDERRKWREKWRTEARSEGVAEGRAEGRAEAEREFEEWLRRMAQEKGIALDDLPPR